MDIIKVNPNHYRATFYFPEGHPDYSTWADFETYAEAVAWLEHQQ